MATNTEPKCLEIQVRQCSDGYMAWISGLHHIFSVGRSPLEAIGVLVSENKDLFDVGRINFR